MFNDDYAFIKMGMYEFYYGYEKTVCPEDCTVYDIDSSFCELECHDFEKTCNGSEWCFVVTKDGEEIYRITGKHLGEYQEPSRVLAKGIERFGMEYFPPKDKC